MKKRPKYTLKNPRHYWVQAIAQDESILSNKKIFVTACQAHDRAKYALLSNPDVLRVHLWDGTTDPENPDVSKLVNTYDREPFTEMGRSSADVSDRKVIKTQKPGGKEFKTEFVSNKVYCTMGNWYSTRK